MKASLPVREPEQIKQWKNENTYEKMLSRRKGLQPFTLHDGPPYANGNIHVGHTLNKILKDIVVKYKNMAGYSASFIPGWDCHGLPIELGVEKQLLEEKKNKADLSRREIRALCRQYAMKWITKQKEQFERLGILADWDRPYLTMDDHYVASIIRELGRISESGALYRGNKPVYWCPSCATALAEAEIEYANHTSPSIYVKFFLDQESIKKLPLKEKKTVALVIWTTTPWTLPANLALSVNPEFDYAVCDTGSELLILAEGLKEKFSTETGLSLQTTNTLNGKTLEGLKTDHPFINRKSPVLLGGHVTLEAGTGVVHTAPGHGMDDFIVGRKYGLPAYAPVDAHGLYTKDVPEYVGQKAFDCNKAITERLKESGHLIKLSFLKHSYPHCWRCHGPIMFRATPQWFISMEETSLRKKAVAEIHQTQWIPEWGINRILGMVENRPDWCISRQRVWGVPITVFYCKKCDKELAARNVFEHVASLIEKNSPDIWYEWPAEKLLPAQSQCKCGHQEFRKETDILDVWFDSGVSHAAVLDSSFGNKKVNWPADLYLEGSDQHRGWFQTSLITSVATRGKAPFKQVLTHGFVNDSQGKKMSKSKGNVTDPMEFAAKSGAEILRLWVVLEDYRNDVNFSLETIDRISDGYRKIRNTFRYMLGNLYDYSDDMALPDSELEELDQWALLKTKEFLKKVQKAYDSYEFHMAYHALVNYCSLDLSAVYFDVLKDRLYTSKNSSKTRRSSQTALKKIALSLTSALAPLLSFTSEEIWGYLKAGGSVFESVFPDWSRLNCNEVIYQRIEDVLSFRALVNKEIETLRAKKEMGHSLEAQVTIKAPKEKLQALRETKEDVARLFIVSKLLFQETAGPDIQVLVDKAQGQKCARCWGYYEDVGTHTKHQDLCSRCIEAVHTP